MFGFLKKNKKNKQAELFELFDFIKQVIIANFDSTKKLIEKGALKDFENKDIETYRAIELAFYKHQLKFAEKHINKASRELTRHLTTINKDEIAYYASSSCDIHFENLKIGIYSGYLR
ncbi:hypothetical protein [Myroides odoratimimus]|uniref:hypothetical protein n=1 Tax=Myroides odoratimimus TaxID=76832 RepID=UPI0025770DB2|nr:hypothetical protein [Myroides odoratimimus]MDM1328106.1 hypothetical protein [Myroides odoratimimus]